MYSCLKLCEANIKWTMSQEKMKNEQTLFARIQELQCHYQETKNRRHNAPISANVCDNCNKEIKEIKKGIDIWQCYNAKYEIQNYSQSTIYEYSLIVGKWRFIYCLRVDFMISSHKMLHSNRFPFQKSTVQVLCF